MPLLGALIQTLLVSLGGFLLRLFLARLALRIAGVAAIVAAGAALMVTYNAIVSPLVQSAFNSQYGQVLGLAFPPVSGTCMAALGAIWAACGLYSLNRRAVQLTSAV